MSTVFMLVKQSPVPTQREDTDIFFRKPPTSCAAVLLINYNLDFQRLRVGMYVNLNFKSPVPGSGA